MEAEQFTIRLAGPEEDAAIATLVVEGFLDKFRPIFGRRMDRSVKIMEKWVGLEHASGGVTSLVIEGYTATELAGSVGVRTAESREDVLAHGLWRTLSRNLGFPHALWATTLLSYPRYSSTSSEAYVERLVVAPAFRRHGPAPALGGRGPSPRLRQKDRRPPRQRHQRAGPQALRGRGVRGNLPPALLPHRLLPGHPGLAVPEEGALIRVLFDDRPG